MYARAHAGTRFPRDSSRRQAALGARLAAPTPRPGSGEPSVLPVALPARPPRTTAPAALPKFRAAGPGLGSPLPTRFPAPRIWPRVIKHHPYGHDTQKYNSGPIPASSPQTPCLTPPLRY